MDKNKTKYHNQEHINQTEKGILWVKKSNQNGPDIEIRMEVISVTPWYISGNKNLFLLEFELFIAHNSKLHVINGRLVKGYVKLVKIMNTIMLTRCDYRYSLDEFILNDLLESLRFGGSRKRIN